MHKQIIHFGQDSDRAEFYNLIVRATDIGSSELSVEMRDEPLSREFTIFYSDDLTIEAGFRNRYMEVPNKFGEMEKDGWEITSD